MEIRCCGLRRGIAETSRLFYACTQLSITAVLQDQTIAAAFGLPNTGGEPDFQTIPLTTTEPQEVVLYDGNSCIFICPICPHGGRVGVFVLGPYVTKPKLAGSKTFRPSDCLPHLVTLLRDIQEGGAERTEKMEPFCFHVQRAVKLMERHYDEDLTLDYVAHYLGLNKSYFSSIFRKQTGQTFTSYLHEIRVEASKKLLVEKSHSILEIALETGFSSQDYYGRIFKKLTGITPSEYRQRGRA